MPYIEFLFGLDNARPKSAYDWSSAYPVLGLPGKGFSEAALAPEDFLASSGLAVRISIIILDRKGASAFFQS
ncbi:hypothetical protein RRF57_000325 [Xylaria bambusicola]|uniref:Uncharacterized protein n=1 Tax=Xylaria bambusicola TaxID=326684 RepID=A0AAN7U9N0_9PEZI